jgi:hypothetical protein
MFGQFRLELEPELLLPELEDPELELAPELVLPELEVPVLPVLEPVLDEGVLVEEPEVELVFGVELVAAPATTAPPATRPVVNAPMATMLRGRICIESLPFISVRCPPVRGAVQACDPDLWAGAERRRRVGGVALRMGDDSQERAMLKQQSPARPTSQARLAARQQ